MARTTWQIGLFLAVVGGMLLACTGVLLAQQTSPAHQASRHLAAPGESESVCSGPVAPGKARCLSKVRPDANAAGAPPTLQNPSGYYPTDLQSAYNLTETSGADGSGETIAIVAPYDDPRAERDLRTYRDYFHLPECSTKNGCFKKVNQRGAASRPPTSDEGWALETSLDLDMVSAICPNCKILLVETDDNSLTNLVAGVDYAAAHDANAISNSYGADEFSGETSLDSHYHHPGVAITAASGDNGYGVGYPAASRFVTAVGGTSLKRDSTATHGWSERVWGGTSSGCSAYVPKPRWQTDSGCSRRTVADVAAVADPNTGVATYDSFGYQGKSGWFQVGGTSVASPIIASVYALAGNYGSIKNGSYPYRHASSLYDITSGRNGRCIKHKSKAYLCTGKKGYDGPTGNGTPNGTGAF